MGWGLALSAGGLLGAAHLGVLRAFAEWGLRPETLAGASAGGLVAGFLAAGGSLEDLIAFGQKISDRPLHYLRPRVLSLTAELLPGDPLPPPDSILDSTPLVEGIVALCPRARTTDDWCLPTALTAVDLGALEAVVFIRPGAPPLPLRGRWRTVTGTDLKLALQATMAMPGVYSAVRSGEQFLVDGGLADTLPVDWAAALGAERVLAVDVAPPTPGVPPRAGLLWSLAQSLAYGTASISALRRPQAMRVLTLAPDTRGVGGFEFSAYPRLVEAGYSEAVRRKEEIVSFLAG